MLSLPINTAFLLPHTFCQPVWDLRLVFAAHPDLPLIGQKRFLDGVKHQRVEEAILEMGGGTKKGVYLHSWEAQDPPPPQFKNLGGTGLTSFSKYCPRMSVSLRSVTLHFPLWCMGGGGGLQFAPPQG